MDEKQINKAIGYAVMVIIGYNIVGVFIPMLTWAVVGMVAWRIYQAHQKYKK